MKYFNVLLIGLALAAIMAWAITPTHKAFPADPPKESYCLDMKPELLTAATNLIHVAFPDDKLDYVLGGYILVNKHQMDKGNLLLVVVVNSGIDNRHNTQAVRYIIIVKNFQPTDVCREDMLHCWDENLRRWL